MYELDNLPARNAHCWAILSAYSIAHEIIHQQRLSRSEILAQLRTVETGTGQSLSEALDPSKSIQVREQSPALVALCNYLASIVTTQKYKQRLPRLYEKFGVNPNDLAAAIATKDSIDVFINYLCNDLDQTEHPDLPNTSAFTIETIKCRYFGFAGHDANCGVFALVREVRGYLSSSAQLRNMISRDILWLTGKTGKTGKKANRSLGYLFSSIDKKCYSITHDTHDAASGKRTLFAQVVTAYEDAAAEKEEVTFSYYAKSLKGSNYSKALLTGLTRSTERSGAWLALMIKPDWKDIEQIRMDLSALIVRPHDAVEYLRSRKSLGFVYMREESYRELLPKKEPQLVGWNSEFLAPREAFHALMFGNGKQCPEDSHGRSLVPREDFMHLVRMIKKHKNPQQTADELAEKVLQEVSHFGAFLQSSQILLSPIEGRTPSAENIKHLNVLTDRDRTLFFDWEEHKLPS